MKETPQWLKDLFTVRDTMAQIAGELHDFASAFNETGNEKMADRLWDMRRVLLGKRDLLDKATNAICDDQFNSARAATYNMLGSLLAFAEKPQCPICGKDKE